MKFASLLTLSIAASVSALFHAIPQAANWSPYYTNTLAPMEWLDIKTQIAQIVAQGYGPVLLRLSFHDVATFNNILGTGGPHATIDVQSPADPHNRGIFRSLNALKPIYDQYQHRISNADLWSFAGCVAVKAMNGPNTPWRPGRQDFDTNAEANLKPEENKLADSTMKYAEIFSIFNGRYNMSRLDIVALIVGGHGVGRSHQEFSGYEGSWTATENTFSNFYGTTNNPPAAYRKEDVTLVDGTKSFQMKGHSLLNGDSVLMLPSDLEIFGSIDPNSADGKIVQGWFKDKKAFFKYWSDVFERMLEIGLDRTKLGRVISCDPADII